MQPPIYLDVNSQYGITTGSILLQNAGAINNSLYNLLTCPIGSRGFAPEYGTLLERYIQDPFDALTAQKIRMNFIQAIERWEPRIVLNLSASNVYPRQAGDGFDVVLAFYIPSLSQTSTLSMSVYR